MAHGAPCDDDPAVHIHPNGSSGVAGLSVLVQDMGVALASYRTLLGGEREECPRCLPMPGVLLLLLLGLPSQPDGEGARQSAPVRCASVWPRAVRGSERWNWPQGIVKPRCCIQGRVGTSIVHKTVRNCQNDCVQAWHA